MNKTKSIIRIIILIVLVAAGLVLIFNNEIDEDITILWIHAILDKAFGIGLLIASGLLYNRWSVTDAWISRYEEWNKKESEYEIWD